MENVAEIIPFVMEMLRQKPSRSLLKIYMLGSSLAILGAMGSVVGTILMPFMDKNTEDDLDDLTMRRREKQVWRARANMDQTDVADVDVRPPPPEVAKYLETSGRRSSAFRLYAS